LSETDGERKEKMAPVGAKADELVKRYPGRVEALIWDGIVTSDRASLTWGLTALNLATRARDLLLEAEKLDPKAVDAGAPTSSACFIIVSQAFLLAGETQIKLAIT
jgi:hypothetical protein